MTETLTSAQMRSLERKAIDSGKVTGLDLMERAGEGVVAALVQAWPELADPGRAIVLCGPGNNGGDGFVVARLLADRGWDVEAFFYGNVEALPPDARANHDRWQASVPGRTHGLSFPRVRPEEVQEFSHVTYGGGDPAIIVDGLFGIGLTRPIDGLAELLEEIVRRKAGGGPRHVSIDLPSGLAEEGPLGTGPAAVFPADLTVSFHRRKTAHARGLDWCGRIVVADIGL